MVGSRGHDNLQLLLIRVLEGRQLRSWRALKAKRRSDKQVASKLYVGNLSYETTEEGLRAMFGEDGRTVSDVTVVMDRMTGRSRGFAFVQMGSGDEAQAAMQALDGREVDGRPLRVSEARERNDRPKRDNY